MLFRAWFLNNLQHYRGTKLSKNKGFSITSAERYSLALFELSEESNLLSQIEDQSSSILNLIEKSEDFSNLIKDPTTGQEDLLKVINTISENNKFESLFKNFLCFLIYFFFSWNLPFLIYKNTLTFITPHITRSKIVSL